MDEADVVRGYTPEVVVKNCSRADEKGGRVGEGCFE